MGHFAFVMKAETLCYPTNEEADFLRDFIEDGADYRVISMDDLDGLTSEDKRKFRDVIAGLKEAIRAAGKEENGAITVAID